jgi:hypothetical protein
MNRTDLPSVKAPNFEQRIRETLMTYLGRQGDPLDRGLTLRDLVENGIISIREGYNLRPGAGSIPLQPGGSFNPELDLTPPPQPSGFAVSAAISHIFIEHDEPTYTQGGGHFRTRVYGATWESGPLPVFNDAVEITQFTGTINAYPTNPSTTWHLWIKWETNAGVLSPTPAGGTNGLVATTGQDVADLLDALTGQLNESQLTLDLNTRIDLIDAPASTVGSVAYQVAQEAAIRADQISIETFQRIQGVQSAAEAALNAAIAADNERQDRIVDVAVAKTELYTDIQTGLSAEAGERTLLAAQLRGGYTGTDLNQVTTGLLYEERIARANQDNSLALQITLLAAGVGEQFDWADIWYFDTSVEGWGGNGTPTAVAGFLRPAEVGSGAYVNTPAGLALDAAKYKQVRLRIRKVGTPTFAGFIWWNAEGQSWDAARRLAFDEPTYDANGIGLSTVNLTWTGTIDQIRVDLSSAQTGTDYFEIDWFAVGRPSPGASTAQILEEQQARATADAAEAASRESLAVSILGQADPTGLTIGNLTQGLIHDEREARVTGDSANASNLLLLEAEVTNLTGDVTTLNSTVSVLEQAVADTTGTSAGITQELLSTRRKLDVDAETVLRTVVAGQATRTDTLGEVAIARTDLNTRIEEGLSAEAQQRLLLAAIVDDNTAAIASESTARADGDSALSTTISTVSATANAKNRTYYQTTAPTVGLVTGDLWFDTDDSNKPYRWNGALWQETADTRIAGNTAAITNEQIARADADSALASDITTLSATVDDNTVAIQTEATTRATETGELFAKYTVKIDNNGYVSGFGLASTANNATPFSEFTIVADKFSIAPVASNPTAEDGSPFFYLTSPTEVGGVQIPAGAYMKAAYIHDATITNAKIADLAVDNAKIANVAVDKLTAGSIAVGQHIQSTGYVAGSAGWRINGDGTAEMNNVVVRGGVYATYGLIGGITIANNAVRAGQTAFNTGAGFYLGQDGTFSVGDSEGSRLTWDGSTLNVVGGGTFSGALSAASGTFAGSLSAATGTFTGNVSGGQFTTGAMTGYAWPPAGQIGTYLGPSGLLLGNANDNKYFQVTAAGNIYAPGFNVVDGALTVNQANVIDTLQLNNNSVTFSAAASGASTLIGSTLTLKAGVVMRVSAFVDYEGFSISQSRISQAPTFSYNVTIDGVTRSVVFGADTANDFNDFNTTYYFAPRMLMNVVTIDNTNGGTRTLTVSGSVVRVSTGIPRSLQMYVTGIGFLR